MRAFGWNGTLLLLLGWLAINNVESSIGTRANTPLVIEIVAVADYSVFDEWYKTTDSSLPHATRVNIAKHNLTTWVGTTIHSANFVYKELEAHNLFISLKLVDLRVMTTVADSPWTETTKFKMNSTYMIDYRDVHPLFKPTSLALQKTIPHDHAMLLTRYTMTHRSNGTHFYAGNTFLASECKPKSQSIIKETRNMYTANTIAHELGHTLGCEHDGDNNACADGYVMAPQLSMTSTRKWTFSSCSVQYIRNFITKLNSEHHNCLASVNDNHVNMEVYNASQKWVGEVFTHDQLCVGYSGKGSYFCRDKYNGNFTGMCRRMFCYNPYSKFCTYTDAGDGIPCGTGSWCKTGECVKDSRVSQSFSDTCVAGDEKGAVDGNKTCAEIVADGQYNCLRGDIKYKCCGSCRTVTTHTVPADTQCQQHFGDGSYMCRYSSYYHNNTYSKICHSLLCTRPTNPGYCNGMKAYDKTSCGDKMWCMNGECVHNTNAVSVHEASCIPGDRQGVVVENQTCAHLVKNSPRRCLDSNIKRLCCMSCSKVHVSAIHVDEQCSSKFGQGSKMCRDINSYTSHPNHPYSVICGGLYCSNTTVPSMCHWMRPFDMTPCGDKKWCKSGHCVHDDNAPASADEKCLLGDQTGPVHNQQTCQDVANSSPTLCLQSKIKRLCCSSCKTVNITTIPSVDAQCAEMYGDGFSMNRHLTIYNSNNYEMICSRLYCRDTKSYHSMHAYEKTPCGHKKWCIDGQCVQDDKAPAVLESCPMGDHKNDTRVTSAHLTCAQIAQPGNHGSCYSSYTVRECCKTCVDIRSPIKGCEYGDKSQYCRKSDCGRYQQDALARCCETCRGAAIVG
ncbi:uncharacterized protein LOC132749885 [Ruditapes philippinarum]|uniref:uncharacterized protein LOC132749885 n=1 Tax=Ruditapes philippinarum TaxID=129788 RepID=UPI00295BC550|nr:uncharacterized protein LOC132749885 [Ruditapes philippinarum]